MRVLYLLNYAGNGGSERYIETLIAQLGSRVTPFFAYSDEGPLVEKLGKLGVPCFQLTMNSPYDLKAAKSLANYCRGNNIDVVHTHFMRENFIAVLAKWFYKSGAKVINTVHMTDRKTGIIRIFNTLISTGNIATIAVSKSVLFNLRVEKIFNPVLIYNGVDTSYFSPEPIPHEQYTIVCVGRFSSEKGQKYLIDAARQLPDFRFVLVGDGELLDDCKSNAPDNCEFPGYIEDTRKILNSADLYVCPSLEEALGLSVLEGMACGLPAVVTDAGGLPELVTSDCGAIVLRGNTASLANAIAQEYKHTSERAKRRGGALKRVREHFDIETTAQQTLELYNYGTQNDL